MPANEALVLTLLKDSQSFLLLGNVIDDYFPSKESINLSITVHYEVAKTPNSIPGILRKS